MLLCVVLLLFMVCYFPMFGFVFYLHFVLFVWSCDIFLVCYVLFVFISLHYGRQSKGAGRSDYPGTDLNENDGTLPPSI